MTELAQHPAASAETFTDTMTVDQAETSVLPPGGGFEMMLEDESSLTSDHENDVLDLSGQGLEKLRRAAPEWQLHTTTLILDDNNLQRMDNIHTYQCIEKVRILPLYGNSRSTSSV